MFRERDNLVHFSEDVNMVIYHKEGKRVMIGLFLMVILSNKIMQNYHKNHPQKGVRVIYPDSVVTKNGSFPSMSPKKEGLLTTGDKSLCAPNS